jgi:polyisoprenoid-binding protein YceI
MTTTPTTSTPLLPGTWALDASHTAVGFSIRRLGLSKVRGTFADVTAELVVGPTPAESSLAATVAMASVDTGNVDRDEHLRSPELLDVAQRPTMAFRSTRVTGDDDRWTVEGDLTIGAITKPLTLDVELNGVNPYIDGSRHAGFEATGEVRRSDYGLDFGPLGALLGDAVKIEIDVEFVEPS